MENFRERTHRITSLSHQGVKFLFVKTAEDKPQMLFFRPTSKSSASKNFGIKTKVASKDKTPHTE